MGKRSAGLDLIFHPALPCVQIASQDVRSFFILPMVGEFPGIVELFPGGKPGAFREQLFKNTQVAVRIAGFQFSVGYGRPPLQPPEATQYSTTPAGAMVSCMAPWNRRPDRRRIRRSR